MRISLATAESYVRTFWYWIVAVPLFGVLLLTFGRDRLLQAVGLMAILWPLTIPARAFILSSRASRRLILPTTVYLGADALRFEQKESSFRLKAQAIYKVRQARDLIWITTRKMSVFFIPADAFLGEEELKAILSLGV